jgi:hypothetical protein
MAILYNSVRYKAKKSETEDRRELLREVLGADACKRLIEQAHEDIRKKKGASR